MSAFENAVGTDARHGTFNQVQGNQTNITHQHVDDDKILATLRPVDRGGYDVPRCMEGTRQDVFRMINHWLNDFGAPNILWISGSPGAGKSAVASSLVLELTMQQRKGSRFFCVSCVFIEPSNIVLYSYLHDLRNVVMPALAILLHSGERSLPTWHDSIRILKTASSNS